MLDRIGATRTSVWSVEVAKHFLASKKQKSVEFVTSVQFGEESGQVQLVSKNAVVTADNSIFPLFTKMQTGFTHTVTMKIEGVQYKLDDHAIRIGSSNEKERGNIFLEVEHLQRGGEAENETTDELQNFFDMLEITERCQEIHVDPGPYDVSRDRKIHVMALKYATFL